MKKCPYCNSQMADEDLFCSECGKKFQENNVCVHCGAIVKDSDLFCSNCGAKTDKREDAPQSNKEDIKTEIEHDSLKSVEAQTSKTLAPLPLQIESDNEEELEEASSKKYGKWIVIALIVIALIGVGAYFFLNRSNKENVSINNTDEQIFDSVIVKQQETEIEIEEIAIDSLELLARALSSQGYQSVSSFKDGLAMVCDRGKYGFIDKCGDLIIPCVYDEAKPFYNGVAGVKKDGSWGAIDITGKEIAPCSYEDYSECSINETVFRMKKNGKWGLINNQGTVLTEFVYSAAFPGFYEGVASVSKDGKYGFVNNLGKEISPCVYDVVESFSGGLAAVKKDGKWGFINKQGVLTIPIIYNHYICSDNKDYIVVEKNGNWGLINKSGEAITPFEYSAIEWYEENYTAKLCGNLIGLMKDGKWGFLNKQGKEVIPFVYDDVYDNLHGIDGYIPVKKEGKWGFISLDGSEVVPCKYDDVGLTFCNGMARIKDFGSWGFVDNQGTIKIPCIYYHAIDFSCDLAAVDYNGKWGFIDKQGNVVIDFKYDTADGFVNGFASVGLRIDSNDGGYYYDKFYIDKNGNKAYTWIDRREGLSGVSTGNGKFGFVDEHNNEVIPCIYDKIQWFKDGLCYVEKNGKYGFIDGQGRSTFDYYSDNPIEVVSNNLSQSVADYVNSRLKNQYRNCKVDKSQIFITKDNSGKQIALFSVIIGDMEYLYSVENIQLNSDGSVQQANIVSYGVMPLIENYGYDVQFREQSDVWSYVRGHKFKSSSGTILEVKGTNLYFNGTQVGSRLRVEMQQGIYSTAYLVSSNAYLWVNGSSHDIYNMVDGTTYKEVK